MTTRMGEKQLNATLREIGKAANSPVLIFDKSCNRLLIRYAKALCSVLPLNRWEIEFIADREYAFRASADIVAKDKIALISVDSEVQETDELFAVLLHELLHLVLSPFKDTAFACIKQKEKSESKAETLFCHALHREEELVVDLTAALAPVLSDIIIGEKDV